MVDKSFGELKAAVLSNLESLNSIAALRRAVHLNEYLGEIKQRLVQGRFNLVVLGEFKRGKTTFLNALLGAKLLPTAVVPLTSIITLIEYGERTKAEVVFLNGDTREITLDDLPAYVTEEGNPSNEKKVKLVKVENPSPYLKDGVVLIDTPGVGSIYQNNTDETYNYLPRVDAAIFLLSSDQPISQSELEFLKDIVQYSAKTFFVLNKIDYLTGEDMQKALEYSGRVLTEKVGLTEVNIYPLSAKLALEGKINGDMEKLKASRLPVFTDKLENFLLAEKGRTAISAACGKSSKVAGEIHLGLELEMKALEIPIEELKAKIGLFDDMVKGLRQEQEDNGYIFRGEMDKVYHELEREITRFQETHNDLIIKEVDDIFYKKKELSGRELMQQLGNYIEDRVRKALDGWQPSLEKKVREAFDRVVSRFSGRTNQVIGELLRQSAEIFDLKLEGFAEIEALTDDTRLYYIFGEDKSMLVPDAVKLYALFLPKFLSGPAIMREMKRKVERELDRNCGRIRTDFTERIIKSAKGFKSVFDAKFSSAVEGTRTVLTRAVEKREHGEKEAAEARSKLAGQMKALESIKSGLQDISRLSAL
ncbi:MAG: dynamin family protein [Eubacteriales bacterium]